MKKNQIVFAAIILAAVVIISLAVGYYSGIQQNEVKSATASQTPDLQISTQSPPTAADGEIPFFSEVFRSETPNPDTRTWSERVIQIIVRLSLAVFLSAMLAFRPRKDIPLLQRNLYVSQTQILLAVVAAALMMIVGDNAARAFAIFAAVSLVRFRTNIRDPKEVTVLLISLAIGLAAGVGRWELGIALCLFSLVLLRLLEYNEPEQAFRAMELTVKTRNTDTTQKVLKKIFRRYKLETEVREIDPPDEAKPIGSIVYYLNLRLNLSTDYLSDRILTLDSENIEGIQWEQKKNAADVYQ
ncbi:MAG: DUF4956 domain-containing protein [Acidobacteriota bacterium]|nr:DUF4956 domain-containing protein [Acidobacteriota bacterium]